MRLWRMTQAAEDEGNGAAELGTAVGLDAGAGPRQLGIAGTKDQGTGSLEDAVDAAQATGDEAGLGKGGAETTDAQA